MICDSYSGGCISPAPSLSPSTAVPKSAPLPRTGMTGGDLSMLLLLALLLIVAGALLTRTAFARR